MSAAVSRKYTHLSAKICVRPCNGTRRDERPIASDCNQSASKNFAGFTAAFPRRVLALPPIQRPQILWRKGGDDFFEARIAAERVPEGEQL